MGGGDPAQERESLKPPAHVLALFPRLSLLDVLEVAVVEPCFQLTGLFIHVDVLASQGPTSGTSGTTTTSVCPWLASRTT